MEFFIKSRLRLYYYDCILIEFFVFFYSKFVDKQQIISNKTKKYIKSYTKQRECLSIYCYMNSKKYTNKASFNDKKKYKSAVINHHLINGFFCAVN